MRSVAYDTSNVSDSEQIIMIGEESDDVVDHDFNIKIVNYTVTQGVTEPDSIENGATSDVTKCAISLGEIEPDSIENGGAFDGTKSDEKQGRFTSLRASPTAS